MRIALKECVWEPLGDDLLILADPREVITLADPESSVAALFSELGRGPLTVPELHARLAGRGVALLENDVRDAIGLLDELGLVEQDDGRSLGDAELDGRHRSNLAFFSMFAGMDRPRAEYVHKLRRAHVLVLGVGGGGSSLLQCLAGLGVGRLTLVDRDEVVPRNFARQFVYRQADLGRSKVERAAEWVRDYDPSITVRPVERWISCAQDLKDLLDGVDLIAGGLDSHVEAPLWVNEAAVRAGVPLVLGGMVRSQLTYYSVDPGNSACVRCDWQERPSLNEPTPEAFVERNRAAMMGTNMVIGPLAMQIGSLVAYEALRYLTGFEPPRAAGTIVQLDLRTGLTPHYQPITRDPECPVCAP